MRIALKFAAAMSLLVAVILVVLALFTMRREAQLIEDDLRRDTLLIAESLAVSAERGGVRDPDDAGSWLAVLNARQPTVDTRWMSVDEARGLPSEVIDALEDGEPSSPDVGSGASYVSAWAPVRDQSALVGVIEVRESLSVRDAFVSRTRASTLLSITLVILASGALSLVVGRVLVGSRVEELVTTARRVAAGDLEHRTPVVGADELTDLAAELNGMIEQLAGARQRIAASVRAQVQAEEQLRHAQRLSTVGRLASGMAHELGTPLNVIIGRASRIAGRQPEGETARDARVIRDQSHRMAQIVRQLLDFSRRGEPARRRVDVCAVVRGTVDVLEPLAQKQGVEVDVRAEPERIEACVDRTQIGQVMTNLVLNGIQAMPQGGVLRVTVREGRRFLGGEDVDVVSVEVADEGVGFDPELAQTLFEPFFTTKEPGEGTGLGLSVAHGIVRDHGGEIAVDARPGEGAVFTVHLPRGLRPEEIAA